MHVPKGERLTDDQIKELSMNIQLDIVPPASNATPKQKQQFEDSIETLLNLKGKKSSS